MKIPYAITLRDWYVIRYVKYLKEIETIKNCLKQSYPYFCFSEYLEKCINFLLFPLDYFTFNILYILVCSCTFKFLISA